MIDTSHTLSILCKLIHSIYLCIHLRIRVAVSARLMITKTYDICICIVIKMSIWVAFSDALANFMGVEVFDDDVGAIPFT